MYNKIFIFFIFLFFKLSLWGQVTVSGHVKDKNNGEPLIGAVVRTGDNKVSAFTDNAGYFTLSVPNSIRFLYADYLGYKTDSLPIGGTKKVFFKLQSGVETTTIDVVVNKDSLEVRKAQTGRHELNLLIAKSAPMMLGESDIMKSLQYLPGVKGTMEGGASFSVRGGSPDQNLVIYDGVPIYNTNHAFGLFSVFTTESIKKVVMYKSGFPAKWGERMSSIIDISMKDGNMKDYHVQAAVSTITGSLFYEGPIIKDKLSLVFSARRSYVDVFIQGLPDVPKPYFYDLSSKLTWNLNDKIKLAIGVYNGDDKLKFKEQYYSEDIDGVKRFKETENALSWGNNLVYLKGNILHKNNAASNISLFYSRYHFAFNGTDSVNESNGLYSRYLEYNYLTAITDFGLRYDWSRQLNKKHQLGLGGGYIYHQFTPDFYTNLTRINGVNKTFQEEKNQAKAHEMYAYLQDEWYMLPNLLVNFGLRGNSFKSDSSQWYLNVEPRITGSLALGGNQSLKASAMLVHQYVHLLSVSSLSLPLDAWVPSTNKIKPGRSYQFDLSYEKIMKKSLKITASVYYKKIYNSIDQNPDEPFLNFKNWETKVAMTNGNAYGLELFLEKTRGRLTGSLAYTLAWSNRKYQNELLNNNAEYRYRYDRRHDLSLVLRWQIGGAKVKSNGKIFKKYLTTSFMLASGNLYSLPTGIIPSVTQENPSQLRPFQHTSITNVYYLENINNYEAPSSHRLDLAYSIEKQNKKFTTTWTFGVFNAYNNINTFAITVSPPESNPSGIYQIKQYGTFPILPFISLKVDFNSRILDNQQ